MLKDATVRARISHKLKHDAESILGELGISMSEAITLFLSQVRLRKGLPFDVMIPNAKTRRAIQEAQKGVGVKKYDSVDAFFEDMGVSTDASSKDKE